MTAWLWYSVTTAKNASVVTKKQKQTFRGLAQPSLSGTPLVVRLCEAFVDNLALMLRVALVAGGLFLVQELQLLHALPSSPQPEPVQPVVEQQATPEAPSEPWRTEGLARAERCTYRDYWTRHYDECFPEGSEVYPRPETAESDDSSFLFDERDIMFARLD